MGKQWQTLFLGAPKSLQMVTAAMKIKDACLLLGRKVMSNLDSLSEKEMAPHSSTLAWKLSWTEEPGGCSPSGRRESDRTERLTLLLPIYLMDVGSATPSVHSVLISKLLLPLVVPLGESIGFLVVPPA